MIVHKLNESYSAIEADPAKIKTMFEYLKVEKPGAYFDPAVQRGFKSPNEYFGSIQNKMLVVMNGHLQLLKTFGVEPEILQSDYSVSDIKQFLQNVNNTLPFPPYDYQEKAFEESILNVKQINKMCTSSGKSMTISLIAEFFRRQGKKGLLLVPNINLLTQFKSDIKDYNLIDLYNDTHTIGGGNSNKHFNCSLTISTWQSMMNYKEELDKLDYVITDEAHRFASDETAAIVKETVNCKYKWGFTGTLPESPIMKMELFGLFGLPKTYITSAGLIDRGLATPIKINSIIFKYDNIDKGFFKEAKVFAKQLKLVKDHEARNKFITDLGCKLRSKGNTLILGQHVDHLKTMYLGIMEKLYPEVKNIENKQITGKNSFDFQEKYGVYYISGSDDAKTRELTRKIIEEDLFSITLEDDSVIRLHGNKEVQLTNGYIKLVKDLTEEDEIDDNFIHKNT
jgi:hypothetical protein